LGTFDLFTYLFISLFQFFTSFSVSFIIYSFTFCILSHFLSLSLNFRSCFVLLSLFHSLNLILFPSRLRNDEKSFYRRYVYTRLGTFDLCPLKFISISLPYFPSLSLSLSLCFFLSLIFHSYYVFLCLFHSLNLILFPSRLRIDEKSFYRRYVYTRLGTFDLCPLKFISISLPYSPSFNVALPSSVSFIIYSFTLCSLSLSLSLFLSISYLSLLLCLPLSLSFSQSHSLSITIKKRQEKLLLKVSLYKVGQF
jgi:hypothetical protein